MPFQIWFNDLKCKLSDEDDIRSCVSMTFVTLANITTDDVVAEQDARLSTNAIASFNCIPAGSVKSILEKNC
jgi:hypothetical protein